MNEPQLVWELNNEWYPEEIAWLFVWLFEHVKLTENDKPTQAQYETETNADFNVN